MRRLLYILFVLPFLFSGCMKLVDDEFWTEVNELEDRIVALEAECRNLNETVESLFRLTQSYDALDYIKSVEPIVQNNRIVGYRLVLGKGGPVNLYHGKDGADGYTPVVSLALGSDGIYYWTVDGGYIRDSEGNPIGINNNYIPRFRIEDKKWYLSHDNGLTWIPLGPAVGDDGKTFIFSIQDGEKEVTISLIDGTVLKFPRYKELKIDFSFPDVQLSGGDVAEIEYKVDGMPDKYLIEAIASNGWVAQVVEKDDLSGYIRVKSPKRIADTRISVFVNNRYGQMTATGFCFKNGSFSRF